MVHVGRAFGVSTAGRARRRLRQRLDSGDLHPLRDATRPNRRTTRPDDHLHVGLHCLSSSGLRITKLMIPIWLASMSLAACSGVTKQRNRLGGDRLAAVLVFLDVQHVVDGEHLDVLKNGSRDGFVDAAVWVANEMDHHVHAVARQNQTAAAADRIDFDGRPDSRWESWPVALLVGALAKQPDCPGSARRHRAWCGCGGLRRPCVPRWRPLESCPFGHCSSFNTLGVNRSPMPMSAVATKTPAGRPPRCSVRLADHLVMPIDATRPQPRANNNRARDLGRIGKLLLDGFAPHDRGCRQGSRSSQIKDHGDGSQLTLLNGI